ncbi:MAG: Na/Pi cotransporter family protein [Clostridia bacterium]|nr:Na/Pi cotransporter family protein [Clostridia bacterium]
MTASLTALTPSNILTIISSLLMLLGGVAAFIIGMNLMGSNLERAAGKSMRRLMSKAAKNRFRGVATGAAVTAIVTSSSATTVMIVGFVNVGLMTLTQAASVIMGANIGTTVTAFLTAISTAGDELLIITALFAFSAFVGVLMAMISKKDKIKRIGAILQGLGLIFVGMRLMSMTMDNMLADENIKGAIEQVFIGIGRGADKLTWQIIVLFLLGAALTGLMQSSAAITAIVISLANANLITLPMGMFIILGTNVGTCVTALFSSLGTNVNARRTAVVHLLFNILGSIIFIIPLAFISGHLERFLNSLIPNISWQIAIFHMLFNVLTTAILIGFVNYLVKLACLIVPDKGSDGQRSDVLDRRLLKTPAIAVGQVRRQLLNMADKSFKNYKLSLDMLFSGDLSHKDEFDETEKSINAMHKHIISFLIELSLTEISEIDEKKVSSFYHVASDIERIGDYAENIVEYAVQTVEDKIDFSDHAKEEIREMDLHITNLYRYTCQVFAGSDLNYLPDVEREESATDAVNIAMQQSHLRRMTEGKCTAEAGAIYLQLAVNMERIGDHMNNIAHSVKEYGHGSAATVRKISTRK